MPRARAIAAILIATVAAAPAVGQEQDPLQSALAAFYQGRIDESLAGFDRAVELDPERAPYLWQRGIALYYAGRYEDCRRQLEAHRTVNPNDVENPAWHFLCVAKLDSPAAARNALLPVGLDPRSPMPEIYEMLRGERTPEQVLEAAGTQPLARFYAYLYIGLYYEAIGDDEQAAANLRVAASGAYAVGGAMHTIARYHVAWLERRRPVVVDMPAWRLAPAGGLESGVRPSPY